ncbi:hypothetical protein D3C74_416400 [compost metagenome]
MVFVGIVQGIPETVQSHANDFACAIKEQDLIFQTWVPQVIPAIKRQPVHQLRIVYNPHRSPEIRNGVLVAFIKGQVHESRINVVQVG